MALDLRMHNCLPEHEGPAFRTWSQIIQTTVMSSSSNLPSPLLSPTSWSNLESSFPPLHPAEDFLPFKEGENEDSEKQCDDSVQMNGTQGKRKKTDRSFNAPPELVYAPWKRSFYPENAYGLHMEIKEFYEYMSPSPEEKLMRENVVKKIQDLIHTIWPAARIEIFGSFKTNLYLPTSDIDLVVFGEWEKLPLWTLERALVNENIAESSTIKVLDKASVPIVKLTEKFSNLKVDISFNMDTAVKGAQLIQTYLKHHKVLPYLFLVLKHFLVMRGLNEVFTGGISSYCLMLLTVSFLQMHPRQESKLPNANIGVLLIEFFELYGRNFNYQRTGIKIRDGGCYCSKDEIMREMSDGQFPSLLCIEDPVSKVIDIGKSSYGIMQVKEAFEYAYNVLDSALRNRHYFKINPSSTYLSRIIRVSPELIQYRRWVKSQFKVPDSITENKLKSTEAADTEVINDKIKNESMVQEEESNDSHIQEKEIKNQKEDAMIEESHKNHIDDVIKKTSDLRSDIVKASIKTLPYDKDVSEKVSLCTQPYDNDSCKNECPTHSHSKSLIESNSYPDEEHGSTQFHKFNKCTIDDDKAYEINMFEENRPKNVETLIGNGGDMQWSSDESSSSKPLDITSKTLSNCQVKTSGSGETLWNERSRYDPCEGISQHDLANAQHARQMIISSPEKPCVKTEKWLKQESKVTGQQWCIGSEEKQKDQRSRAHGNYSENSGNIHYNKDQHHKSNDSHHHHHHYNYHNDDRLNSSKHKRRNKKDSKSS